MRTTRALIASLALALAAVPQSAAQGPARAFRGAAIETVGPAGRIDRGALIVRDGKIEAVGKDGELKIPDDARVVDLAGRTIMPGLVEPSYTIGGQGGGRQVVIGGRTITVPSGGPTRTPTFERMAEKLDPYTARFEPLLRSGFTHLNLLADGYGQAAIVRILPDRPTDLVADPDGRLFLSVSNATGPLEVLRNGLKSGKAGGSAGGGTGRPAGSAENDGNSPPNSGTASGSDSGTGSGSGSRDGGTVAATRALWRAVVAGEAPLILSATGPAAILHTAQALEDYPDVRLVLVADGSDVLQAIDALAPRKPVVVLRPAIEYAPNSRDRINAARRLREAGLDLAFTLAADSDRARDLLEQTRDAPLFPVAYLVRTGLPRADALAALTLIPARVVGRDTSIGSIEPGKAADLLIFEGDPLDPAGRLIQVLIDGSVVYEE